ncbi:Protein virilizer [Cynara cardunculus var. scolymus]|uniref:Protein virilizer n=1 Tax=Cynara cardunculus var. scolymus TaxID=59895 RepID=A0A103XH12_CYNCS|nr:Protein virilizer [Cynara cardunculus var. scolymus]
MGRPEPSVLFAQTFAHAHLDEYVDEVIFSEPVIVSACEFLEQSSSSLSPAVTLMGATSPPSFALEVFVHCEGETRFRRLCQPFLYSPSSSNILEVEALVTSHLVVRGSYRSLSLVIYGNTGEDLGQFNIEVDLDSSLTNTVSIVEGNLEDLPTALNPVKSAIEEPIYPLKSLSLLPIASDLSVEMKQVLQLSFKILEMPNAGDALNTVVNSLVTTATTYSTQSLQCASASHEQLTEGGLVDRGESYRDLSQVRKDLLDIFSSLQTTTENSLPESLTENIFLESEGDLVTSKQLVDTLRQHYHTLCNSESFVRAQLPQSKLLMAWLSAALLLCSCKESCFNFVNGGGMKQLCDIFCKNEHSSAATLMLLGVVEQATRNSIGCEGFLGWWPREDDKIPVGISEGYNQLLKLVMQKQRHDIASLATYILHRMRFYEVASRYEFAVLRVLGGFSSVGNVVSITMDMLASAKLQLKKLLKLITSRALVEDPSPVACTSRSLIFGETDGLLSYKATSRRLIIQINHATQERGFLPLSAALLSSSTLRSEVGHAMDLFMDITSYIASIILSLVFCRSGLMFLLLDPELSTTVILALRGSDLRMQESIPLRYASVLISKGFFCRPREIGMVMKTHLRVMNVIDRLITSQQHSEELLWGLWELCCLSRSDCGRQALLAIGHFPEAISVLIAALHSVKELEPVSVNSGNSPLNLAIFHSAVEIFEVIVLDSTASSLSSWIEHAKELHKALHSSSPGSNRKDAPTRLLELIDGGVVYHKNGAIGLLRYAAVLASGGDAHMAATNILACDEMDVDNVVGDVSGSYDGNVIDNLLGKPITESRFLGFTLRDSSVAQLMTTFRILNFISDNSVVAGALYDEGAVMVIHAVVINCKLMLEKSSNNYGEEAFNTSPTLEDLLVVSLSCILLAAWNFTYCIGRHIGFFRLYDVNFHCAPSHGYYLVDEGTECNTTSDILLERNREQSVVDLLVPCLSLLINLLHKLKEAKEQHRNKKLVKALLHLHRELSPKLAACAVDLSYPYPDLALRFEAVCHLLASALACWPVYGWTPTLFHFLLDSLHATSLLAMGPKETCSLLFLLNDLLPDEGASLWKNGMPMLSTFRQLAVGTLLGPEKEREINWYLQAGHKEKLIGQLTPMLHKIAEIVLHCAISALVVIQDMLRIFIIRMACVHADSAAILLRPMILWIDEWLAESSTLTDTDAYKVCRLLDFLASLLEHPCAKPILLSEGAIQMISKVLKSSADVFNSDAKQLLENRSSTKLPQLSWCIPASRSISLISESRTYFSPSGLDRHNAKILTKEDCSLLLFHLLRLIKVLPVGRELVACLLAFKDLGSSSEGRSGLLSVFLHVQSSYGEESEPESRQVIDGKFDLLELNNNPLLFCWRTLLNYIEMEDVPSVSAIEAVEALSSGALSFCMDKSLNLKMVDAVKYLFGIPCGVSGADNSSEDNIKYMLKLTSLLNNDEHATSRQVKEHANSLLLLLQRPSESDDVVSSIFQSLSSELQGPSKIQKISNFSIDRVEHYNLDSYADKFMWECPENLRDRFSQTGQSLRRKLTPLEAGASRRPRVDNSPAENMSQSAFSRGSGQFAAPSGPTRRDTFRLRKPNTSRPPSMHVDDYVARERNVDGTTSSNVIAVPRIGSSSGRPPSIHVDEFMARERERQNPAGMAGSMQVKNAPPENDPDAEKMNKSTQLRPDLDDDLQGLNIVFGGEESESDDGLPFPQPDDNLQQPASVIDEQNSPHSIVEETESDVNESSHLSHLGTPLASNFDESNQSDFSSRISVSRPEKSLTREPSISSEKKYFEPEDSRNGQMTSGALSSAKMEKSSGFSSSANIKNSKSSTQGLADSRMPPILCSNTSLGQAGNASLSAASKEFYEQKFPLTQPPLPPMPPPPTISPVHPKTLDSNQSTHFQNSMRDVQPPLPPGFHVHSEYARASLPSSGGSVRPQPPLPPTPPPYTAAASLSSLRTSTPPSSAYSQSNIGSSDLMQGFAPSNMTNLSGSGALLTSYPPPPLMPPMLFNRPGIPFNLYGTNPPSNQGENHSNLSQSFPIALSSIQPLTQLQPLQPPQLPRPPQPPQHLRPPIPASTQSEQGMPSSVQMQVQQLQMVQPALGDRDKLVQLLEQHPKLMQMLQDKLHG